MLFDAFDNLPRNRWSATQLQAVADLCTALGVLNVPSVKTLRKIQKGLQAECGYAPRRIESFLGNVFYMNDIRDVLARDMANPLVAPHLHFYPEENTTPISETYQAKRWTEFDPSQLTSMFNNGRKRFWINEVAQLKTGECIIPERWIRRDGVLTCDGHQLVRNPDMRWTLGSSGTFNADDLVRNYDGLIQAFGPFDWAAGSDVPEMPNSMRKFIDEEEDLYVLMASPWADDVSGNRSKQYNKHMNMYTRNGCLPGRLIQQEYHVHFLSSSPHASSAEQFAAFRDQVNATEKEPVRCFNTATGRKARFIIRVPGLPADNPQQSDECSHMGVNANFPCRKCGWGGTKQEKEEDAQYHAAHFAGAARNAAAIKLELTKQFEIAMRGDAAALEKLQRKSGIKDRIAQHWMELLIQKVKAMKAADPGLTTESMAEEVKTWLDEQPGDKMNPLLDITGLDPSRDTPVEILHTILLGIIKYIWAYLHTKWSDDDRRLVAIRMQSTDLSGLNVPPIRAAYMMQYKNNLIGKHFKTLMQILAFDTHDVCSGAELALIRVAGELGTLLWASEIDNMDEHCAQLSIAAANVMDAFDAVDPLRILVKIKMHLLAHLPDDVRRFGPAVRFSTETEESFNRVFKLCSEFSNRHAPSRDIAGKFASMDRVKHILSGGFWLDANSGKYIQAGRAVRKWLPTDKKLQHRLGWVTLAENTPGKITPVSARRIQPVEWEKTKAAAHPLANPPPASSTWRLGHSLITGSGDRVSTGAWVVALHGDQNIFGRIAELLHGGARGLVTLEQFTYSQERHPDFNWPILRRPTGAEIVAGAQNFLLLESTDIQFVISVAHDCRNGKCKPVVAGKEVQEREITTRDISLIKHSDDDHFVLNMAGLHHFVRLLRVLPRALTEIRPLVDDREKAHKEAAAKVRGTQAARRAQAAAKRRQTAARKRDVAAAAKQTAADADKAAEEAEELARATEEALKRGQELPPGDEPDGDKELQDEGEGSSDSDDESRSEPEASDDDYTPQGCAGRGALRGREAPQGRKRKRARKE
ncbi:hypothetical protein GGX14DRAFT_372817 [Mycena pura]|uniref:Uncharacterized protein n=1 Tax=Mycena pura TaxID=153505 RepID=A0AAD6V0K2_9AGAR|nr:hypothetical protein GGX14DRAFT_372817 [Mycena pura]